MSSTGTGIRWSTPPHQKRMKDESWRMNHPDTNLFGQPIGFALSNWRPPPLPPREPMIGQYCRVETLDPDRHAEDLYASDSLDTGGRSWTYLPYGPFKSLQSY